MTVQVVYDGIATRVTSVVSAAAVLRRENQMEKLPHYYFSWIVHF